MQCNACSCCRKPPSPNVVQATNKRTFNSVINTDLRKYFIIYGNNNYVDYNKLNLMKVHKNVVP